MFKISETAETVIIFHFWSFGDLVMFHSLVRCPHPQQGPWGPHIPTPLPLSRCGAALVPLDQREDGVAHCHIQRRVPWGGGEVVGEVVRGG